MTGGKKKQTDANAPLNDPWFEEDEPAPELDPSKPPIDNGPRQRKERGAIPKVVI
jgi:hypothetical protein